MQSHLYNTSGGYIVDSFNPATCGYAGSAAVTYKMGLYLEALSVFADTTSNSTLFQLADQLALNAIKSSIWVNTDGVLSDATAPKNVSDNSNFDTAYKGILVRALYEHWTRSQRDSSIANLIKAFLLVQYNAVLNLARYPGTSWYTQSWTGPPVPSLLPWGQLAAADLLNSAVGLAAEPSPIPILSSSSLPSATGSSPPNASSDSNPNSHTPIGAIVGGAVGGFLFAALLSVLLLFIRWRRRKANSAPNQHPSSWYRDQPITRGEGTPELYSRSVEPFPPPLPAVDHFNSSKRSGTPQSLVTVSQPPTQQTQTEHRDHLPTFEDNTSHDDSISDLLFRLNRAVANLSPLGTADESSTIEPPRYEHIT
ncbi:hypothetical protein QCA50_008101 [Cerrena zonata]|uniref:Glycoside hydrolase family 76 protein n=1 Tax=Cerrena zonata TaxID=2478898 RepID=A0AAW0GEN4_9APHY